MTVCPSVRPPSYIYIFFQRINAESVQSGMAIPTMLGQMMQQGASTKRINDWMFFETSKAKTLRDMKSMGTTTLIAPPPGAGLEDLYDELFESDGEPSDLMFDEDQEDDERKLTDNATRLSLWYGLWRVIWYLQSLYMILCLHVSWPPAFLALKQYLMYTHNYATEGIRWLMVKKEVEVAIFYWNVIEFGMKLIFPVLLLVLVFHFWTINDYTQAEYTQRWVSMYVYDWYSCRRGGFIRSILVLLLSLGACGGITYAMR